MVIKLFGEMNIYALFGWIFVYLLVPFMYGYVNIYLWYITPFLDIRQLLIFDAMMFCS